MALNRLVHNILIDYNDVKHNKQYIINNFRTEIFLLRALFIAVINSNL